jgi:ligand-binding SRPBCC domain-containing protein
MQPHRLYREQAVSAPLEDVFPFFAEPGNLAKITPPSMGFHILTPPPITMRAGALIDYTVRPFGLPMRWRTLITEYDPPHRFVDVQLSGPYSFWHHTHTFEETTDGCKLTDEVLYLLPFGPLGRIVERFAVRSQLNAIFNHRRRVIEGMFGHDR